MLDFFSSWPPCHGLWDLITPFFSLCHAASRAAVMWGLIRSGLLGICFGFSDKSSCSIPLSHNGKVCGQCLFNQKNIQKIPPFAWVIQLHAWLFPFWISCATSNFIHNFGFLCVCMCVYVWEREREREREREEGGGCYEEGCKWVHVLACDSMCCGDFKPSCMLCTLGLLMTLKVLWLLSPIVVVKWLSKFSPSLPSLPSFPLSQFLSSLFLFVNGTSRINSLWLGWTSCYAHQCLIVYPTDQLLFSSFVPAFISWSKFLLIFSPLPLPLSLSFLCTIYCFMTPLEQILCG